MSSLEMVMNGVDINLDNISISLLDSALKWCIDRTPYGVKNDTNLQIDSQIRGWVACSELSQPGLEAY